MPRPPSADAGGQGQEATWPDLPTRQSQLPAALREFHRMVLRAFLRTGRPPQASELRAPAAGLGLDVDAAFGQLASADLVHADSAGDIVVAYPFSGRETGIRVRTGDGPEVWAMCAIDALGIPQMTGSDVVITAIDPNSQEPVRVESSGGRLSWQPGSVVVLVANNGCVGISAEYACPLMTFHTSEQNALDHLTNQPGAVGRVLSQEKAYDLAGEVFATLLSEQPEAITEGQ